VLLSSFIRGKGLHPLLDSTVDLITDSRRNIPDLSVLDLDPELKSIYKKIDGDQLFIVNELHKARGFRKLHLEIARIGSSLQILHCVFFPDPRFNLPIFGVDLVSTKQGISAAIVDLSPVGKDLPNAIKELIKETNIIDFQCIRDLPEWGNIFSSNVCFIKPNSQNEEERFLDIISNYLNNLLAYALTLTPDENLSSDTRERYNYQQFYCLQQKRNDKTRNVLARTFSPEWANRYIDIVLFECPSL